MSDFILCLPIENSSLKKSAFLLPTRDAPLPPAPRGWHQEIASLPIKSCWRDGGGGDALLVRDESESIDISLLGDLDLPSFSRRHGPLLPGRRRARAGPHRRLRRDLLRAVDRREGAGEHKEEEGPGPAGALGAGGLCRDVEGRLRLCLRLCLSSSSFFLDRKSVV